MNHWHLPEASKDKFSEVAGGQGIDGLYDFLFFIVQHTTNAAIRQELEPLLWRTLNYWESL